MKRITRYRIVILLFGSLGAQLSAQTNGNSGIGTTTPGSKLEVKAATCDDTKSALQVKDNCDNSLLYIQNDGKIGMGLGLAPFNPAARLHIKGLAGSSYYFRIDNNSDVPQFFYNSSGALGIGGAFFAHQNVGQENILIGKDAGNALVGGTKNLYIGIGAGSVGVNANNNMFIGYRAGEINTANNNMYIGYLSGNLSTSGVLNTFIGPYTGTQNTTGGYNTLIGAYAGYNNGAGTQNTMIGFTAGNANTASYNTFIGGEAGLTNTIGAENVFIGYQSGNKNINGASNTYIGYKAGYSATTGTGNVFLGNQAGYNETGNNKLYIANSNTANPLIYGDFSTGVIRLSGLANLGVTEPRYVVVDQNGNLSATTSAGGGGGGSDLWTASGSDIYRGSGKVGVGINAPTATLHAYAASGTATNKVFQAGSSTVSDGFYVQENGTAVARRLEVFNPAYTGNGTFRQIGNNSTQISGGGNNENIILSNDGTIRLNAQAIYAASNFYVDGTNGEGTGLIGVRTIKPMGFAMNTTSAQYGITIQSTAITNQAGLNEASLLRLRDVNLNNNGSGGSSQTYNHVLIDPVVNTTAGTTTLRGIYYNPILTSAIGVNNIAFENTTGNILFGTTSGNVGIGTNAPSAQLHTTGSVRLAGITAGTGTSMLVTDADGNVYKQSISGGGGGSDLWTASGSGIYRSTGNIGVGTSSPSFKFHVMDGTGSGFGVKNNGANMTDLVTASGNRFLRYSDNGAEIDIGCGFTSPTSVFIQGFSGSGVGSSLWVKGSGVGIGHVGGQNPEAKLDVFANSGTASNKIFQASSSTASNAFYIQEDGAVRINSGANAMPLEINTNATSFRIFAGTTGSGGHRVSLDVDGYMMIHLKGDSKYVEFMQGKLSTDGTKTLELTGPGKNALSSGGSVMMLGHRLDGGAIDATSGEVNILSQYYNGASAFAPTSGNASFNMLKLDYRIQQSGGTGVTRGLYIAPNATNSTDFNAQDFRAIETTYGNVILNGVDGKTGIGTTSPTAKLHIKNGHLKSEQTTAPTVSVTSSNDPITAATLSSNPTDTKGLIQLTGTASSSAESEITIMFNQSYNSAPVVILTGANASAKTCEYYVTSATDRFVVHLQGGGSNVAFFYQVME